MLHYKKHPSRWSFDLNTGFSVMLFGYELGISMDLSEWHFGIDRGEEHSRSLYLGPIYLDILDAKNYVEPKDPALIKLNELINKLSIENATLKAEREQLEVKLAGCGVAAQGWGELMEKTDYGWSPSYDDARLLHVKYSQALKVIERLRKKLGIKPKAKKTRR